MKSWALVTLAIAALAQLAVPSSMIWNHERTLQHGKIWKFRTRPVDPVDFFRGRYVTLEFEAEEIAAPPEQGMVFGDAWVSLKTDADGFAQVDRVSGTRLTGDNAMKVTARYPSGQGRQQLEFPFNTFWMEETLAPQAEAAYRHLNRDGAKGGYVTVRIHNGRAAIDELFLDGKPVRQYLQEQVPP